MFNIQAAVEATAAVSADMNEAVTGGGGTFETPAAGLAMLRLISYIELGVHEDGPANDRKNKELVFLEFELSGKKYPPANEETGRTKPFTISMTLALSLNEKANFYKLFKRLNHTGEYKHFAQLLGKPFLGTVVIVTKGEGKDAKTYANLKDDGGFTIRPPYHENLEGESTLVEVPPAVNPLKCFLWNAAIQQKEMWDSIFVDGRWPDKTDDSGKVIKEGVSKNYHQNLIRRAQNFKGSPMAELLFAGGDEPDLPASETPERNAGDTGLPEQTGADADPLAGC